MAKNTARYISRSAKVRRRPERADQRFYERSSAAVIALKVVKGFLQSTWVAEGRVTRRRDMLRIIGLIPHHLPASTSPPESLIELTRESGAAIPTALVSEGG